MKKVVLATAFVAGLYSSSWYFLTDHLQKQGEAFLSNLESQSGTINSSFKETEKFGFPFKLGVRFKGIRFDGSWGNMRLTTSSEGSDVNLSTTIFAKVYTLDSDSKDDITLSMAGSPLIKLKAEQGKRSYTVGFNNSPLWSSLLGRDQGTFSQKYQTFKEEAVKVFENTSLESDASNPSLKNDAEALFEKILPLIGIFQFVEIDLNDVVYQYTFEETNALPTGVQTQGVLLKATSFKDKYFFDKSELDQTKVRVTSQHKDLKANAAPLFALASLFLEKNLSAVSFIPEEKRATLTDVFTKISESLATTENGNSPSNLTLDMAFETERNDGEDRQYKIELTTYDASNAFFDQSASGRIEGTLGQDFSFNPDMEGKITLKPTYADSVKTSLTAQLDFLKSAFPSFTPDKVDQAINVLFKGVENIGEVHYKLKGQISVEEQSAFDCKIDDFFVKTKSHGGFSLQGQIRQEGSPPIADARITLYKANTLIDSVSGTVSDLFTFLRQEIPEASHLSVSDSFIETLKRILKALNMEENDSENITLAIKTKDGMPEISGKSWLELALLWNMVSQQES